MDKAEGSTKHGRVVCLDPAELAFRGFVWKLSPVYTDGVFDKSQRLESIVGETVTIRKALETRGGFNRTLTNEPKGTPPRTEESRSDTNLYRPSQAGRTGLPAAEDRRD
jgi:hypothetical protein